MKKIRRRRSRAHLPDSARAANSKALRLTLGRTRAKHPVKAYVPIAAEAVLALRQFLGITQESLATQLGVRSLAVSWWECGRRSPAPAYAAKLRALAEMNGVDLDRITNARYYKSLARVQVYTESVKVPQSPSQEALQV